MANPREPDWQLLKRIGRYLAGAPRAVQVLEWQQKAVGISTYVDSDWAGDSRRARTDEPPGARPSAILSELRETGKAGAGGAKLLGRWRVAG